MQPGPRGPWTMPLGSDVAKEQGGCLELTNWVLTSTPPYSPPPQLPARAWAGATPAEARGRKGSLGSPRRCKSSMELRGGRAPLREQDPSISSRA